MDKITKGHNRRSWAKAAVGGKGRGAPAGPAQRRAIIKRLVPIGLMGLCVLLLACSNAALDSASEALELWWSRVLPALYPFFVLTSWMHRWGLLSMLQKRLRSPFGACFLFGAISGYPSGARVCGMLGRREYAAYCNLCSPMFLSGVVAVGMCGNGSLFVPLALAHYGSALILYSLEKNSIPPVPVQAETSAPASPPVLGSMLEDVASGMQAMLNIGGCIMIFYVPINTLLTAFLDKKLPIATTLLVGMAELTSGCRHAVELGLPTQLTMGLLAFFLTFGGLCVFGQTMLVTDILSPGEYLMKKAAQGFLAAILAYLLTPLLVPSAVAALNNSAQAYGQNALMGLAFIISACVGLTACYLMALILRRPRASDASRHGRA